MSVFQTSNDPRYFWTRVPRFGNWGRTFALRRNDTLCRNHIAVGLSVGFALGYAVRAFVSFRRPSGETTTCILLIKTVGTIAKSERPRPQTATQGRGQQRKSVWEDSS